MGKKRKLFLVLCLHRAGSSATAGVLYHLGVHMGERLLKATRINEKGFYENRDFMKLNNIILEHAGGHWRYPPSRKKILHSKFSKKRLRRFVANHAKPVWGLKDPRTVLTFELWKPYFEEAADITYVFVHRPFKQSVHSLTRVLNRKNSHYARKLLTPYLNNFKYYRDLLQKNNEDIIDVYYEELLKNPVPFVSKINKRLGNPPRKNLNVVNQFLDRKLKKF